MKFRTLSFPPGGLVTAVLLFAALLTAGQAYADRPRVGLVLGGGGARGAAHIGVLRELERHRVPVDAIAGTSMGAIVGGLYATGMSVDELQNVVETLDWADAMSDTLPRKDLSFRRKQDDAQFPINLELGLRGSELLLPMGVIQGQELDLLLRKLTIGVSRISDFDALPIPFRAVASDIERGEAVILEAGDLAQAIRASMAVPGALAPVRIGDRLLVDGGLVGNLPIDVARAMGVDVVIAVDVEFPLYSADDLDSALAISEQMLTILIHKETKRQIDTLGNDDVLIRPELGTFASSDFGHIADTLEPGAAAARAVSDKLQRLALTEREYAEHLAQRVAPGNTDERLAFVRVRHDGRLKPEILESRLDTQVGDTVDTTRLERDAEQLYGLNLYEKVGYRLVEEDGETGVEFQARTKSWGPDTLKFSLALEDDFEGSTGFNVATRLTRSGLNPHGGEWRTDLQLGTQPLLVSEFYQPFGSTSRFFVAPRIDLRQSSIKDFLDESPIARLRVSEAEAGIDIGAELDAWGEVRLGAYRGRGKARVKVGDPALTNFDFDTGGVFARFRIDTLDNAQFPREGLRADVTWTRSLTGLGADDRFDTIESDFSGAWTSGKNTFQLGLNYATTPDADLAIQEYFPLGGFLRLSGLERGEISGPHAALARLIYYRQVGESAGGLFEVPVYLGASVEAGNVWQSRDDISFDSMHVNGSAFIGLDTYIGPLYLAAGLAEGGRTNFYLFIGAPPR